MSFSLSNLPEEVVLNRLIRAMQHHNKAVFNHWISDTRVTKSLYIYQHALRAAVYMRDDFYIHRLLEKAPVDALKKPFLDHESLWTTLPIDICRMFQAARNRVNKPEALECFLERRLNLMLQCGADPNAETDTGRTPLISAVLADAPRLCACLLTWGATPLSGAFFRDRQLKCPDPMAASILNYPKNAYEWALLSPDKSLVSVFDPYLSYEEKIKIHNNLLKKQKKYAQSCRWADKCLLGGCGLLFFLAILGGLSRCAKKDTNHQAPPTQVSERTVQMPILSSSFYTSER